VDPLTAGDWPAVSEIYAEGIATGDATFETTVPSWEEWAWVHMAHHCLVGRIDDVVVGWAALAPASSRPAYSGVAWDSVYVRKEAQGRGVGTALLRALIAGAEDAGIWMLQAGIFPENRPSLSLHLRCGFVVVGIRERIGKLDGVWRDVVLLERRSKEVV